MRPETGGLAWSHPVLKRVRGRVSASDLLESTSVGLALGAAVAGVARTLGWSVAIMAVTGGAATATAAAVWFLRHRARRTIQSAAAAIEQSLDCQNLVVTAVELSSYPQRAVPWVRARVFGDADALLARVDPRAVVRLRRPLVLCVVTTALAATAAIGVHERAARVVRNAIEKTGSRQGATTTTAITITVEPPAYTLQSAQRLTNPERIDIVEGSRLAIEIRGAASVRFGDAPLRVRIGQDVAAAEVAVTESGYLAVESPERLTLIPVHVTPDRRPAIRVDQPGRDLLFTEARNPVGVEATVTDDFGVADVKLRYTRVSGSGEQFDFREGELPLTRTERDRVTWHARGAVPLSSLGLEPGDSLVYRFIARDGRKGDAGTSESDSFFIEIAGPGQAALEGFAMPPDRERYSLSQQMIVLKIERLRDRTRRLSNEALEEQAKDIAAEQRAVKANFVFLMGGHVEDEEVEAEQSTDIQEGRLQNSGRREILRAIEHMTRAEQSLGAIDTSAALREAKLAVESLQRAFGQNRYILRALPVRDRIDPARRLTGQLEDARTSSRSHAPTGADLKPYEIRSLFTSALAATDDLAAGRPVAAQLSILSERALAVDPASTGWQRIAQQLGAVRDSVAAGEDRKQALTRLREAMSLVVREAEKVTLPSVHIVPDATSPLRGPWAGEFATPARPK